MGHDDAQLRVADGDLVGDEGIGAAQRGVADRRRALVEQDRQAALLRYRVEGKRLPAERVELLVVGSELDAHESEVDASLDFLGEHPGATGART
jgi:hypothetical protein